MQVRGCTRDHAGGVVADEFDAIHLQTA